MWGRFSGSLGSVSTVPNRISRRSRAARCRRSRLVTPVFHLVHPLHGPQRARQGLGLAGEGLPLLALDRRTPAAVSRIWMMALRAIVARRRSRPMARRSALPSSASRTNSAWRAAIGARSKP